MPGFSAHIIVIPAKAGIPLEFKALCKKRDPRVRGGDVQ
jgi:hypothetical protein